MLELIFGVATVESKPTVAAFPCEIISETFPRVEEPIAPRAFEADYRDEHCRETRKSKRGEKQLE